MDKTTVGELREILVLETETDGEKSIVVYPKGTIIEISSEEEYPHNVSKEDVEAATQYLKKNDELEDKLIESQMLIEDYQEGINDLRKKLEEHPFSSLSKTDLRYTIKSYLTDIINISPRKLNK